jgi:peptidoglycan/xylan/chitin deacetylase (PgdA/CDA1 family)
MASFKSTFPLGLTLATSSTTAEANKLEVKTSTAGKVEPRKRICLTFDDGPWKQGTSEVLDVLEDLQAPATFFLTGHHMEGQEQRQRELIKTILDNGHQIGNHTLDHYPLKQSQYEKTFSELAKDPDCEVAAKVAATATTSKSAASQAAKCETQLESFRDKFEKNKEYFLELLKDDKPTQAKFIEEFKFARAPGHGKKFFSDAGSVSGMRDLGLVHVGWDTEFAPNTWVAHHKKEFRHLTKTNWRKNRAGVTGEAEDLPADKAIILFHDRHWAGRGADLEKFLEYLGKLGYDFGRLNDSGKCE